MGSTHAEVVSRDSIQIAFRYAALNDLGIFATNIRSAYLEAPSSQKDYILYSPKFGIEYIGKVAPIRRALYGGKSAGKVFRNHLCCCMCHLVLPHVPLTLMYG
jgi:hypothetical protein